MHRPRLYQSPTGEWYTTWWCYHRPTDTFLHAPKVGVEFRMGLAIDEIDGISVLVFTIVKGGGLVTSHSNMNPSFVMPWILAGDLFHCVEFVALGDDKEEQPDFMVTRNVTDFNDMCLNGLTV